MSRVEESSGGVVFLGETSTDEVLIAVPDEDRPVEGVQITGVKGSKQPQSDFTIDRKTTAEQIRALTGNFVVIGSKVQEDHMRVLSEMQNIHQAIIRCSNGYQIIKKLPKNICSVVLETSRTEIFDFIPAEIEHVGITDKTPHGTIKKIPEVKNVFVISKLGDEQLKALPNHIKVLYVLEEHIAVNVEKCSKLGRDIQIKNMHELTRATNEMLEDAEVVDNEEPQPEKVTFFDEIDIDGFEFVSAVDAVDKIDAAVFVAGVSETRANNQLSRTKNKENESEKQKQSMLSPPNKITKKTNGKAAGKQYGSATYLLSKPSAKKLSRGRAPDLPKPSAKKSGRGRAPDLPKPSAKKSVGGRAPHSFFYERIGRTVDEQWELGNDEVRLNSEPHDFDSLGRDDVNLTGSFTK